MPRATFRFYEELNDFLPAERRKRDFVHAFDGTPSVKDQIEAQGVPHTEVDLILIDGEPAGFERKLRGGERVAVYPVFETLDIGLVAPRSRLRPEPLRDPRFVLDVHMGALARRLRMLGFDALWPGDVPDEQLARLSAEGPRILLTRDRGILKRSVVTHGYCVRHHVPDEQLVEVVRRFHLARLARPFTRCMACNGTLVPTEAAAIADDVPDGVASRHDRFARCTACARVFWPGSHHATMRALVERVVGRSGSNLDDELPEVPPLLHRPKGER